MTKLLRYSFIGLGIGATSPLLALVLGGKILSLYTLCILIVFFNLIFTIKKLRFNINNNLLIYFLLWMFISIFACIFGSIIFASIDDRYSFSTLSYIPKILFYIILLILFLLTKNRNYKIDLIIRGIGYGIAFNLIWSILDAICWYTLGFSLTNEVFKSYIIAKNLKFGIASIIEGFSIRSVGLTSDPATIGFFAVIGTGYAFLVKRLWIILVCIFSAISCVSFVALVSIGFVCLYFLFIKGNYKRGLKRIIVGFVLVSTTSLIVVNTNNELVQDFNSALTIRAQSKIEGDHSSQTRMTFLTGFPNVISNAPYSLILGTGYSTPVYHYYKEGVVYGGDNPTELECVYIDNFFSFGLIGFIFFLLFYFSSLKFLDKRIITKNTFTNRVLYSGILSSIICFAFYHYTLYSVIILISFACIIEKDNWMKENKSISYSFA